MGVIRHWIGYEHPDDPVEKHRVTTSATVAAYDWKGAGLIVEGPFVPEADYRGAVDLLREARFYVDARATGSVKAAELLDRIDAALGRQ